MYHRALPFESNLMEVLNKWFRVLILLKEAYKITGTMSYCVQLKLSGCREAQCCVPLSLYVVSFGLE